MAPTDIYKVPLPPLEMEQQLSASLGDSDMEESLLLIKHVINLTPSLIELWLFSAALALFTPRMTGLNYSSSSQLSAPYLSTHPGASRRALLPPLLIQSLTPRIHSLLTLFQFYLAVLGFPSFFSVLSAFLSHSHTMSTLIQIHFLIFILPLCFGLPSALSQLDHAQKMDVFQNSVQSR